MKQRRATPMARLLHGKDTRKKMSDNESSAERTVEAGLALAVKRKRINKD